MSPKVSLASSGSLGCLSEGSQLPEDLLHAREKAMQGLSGGAKPLATVGFEDLTMLALLAWMEVPFDGIVAMRGVIHTVLNRCRDKGQRWPTTPFEVVTQSDQYPLLGTSWPRQKNQHSWKAWQAARTAACAPGNDPTDGSTHYWNPLRNDGEVPSWAVQANRYRCKLGRLEFYKL